MVVKRAAAAAARNRIRVRASAAGNGPTGEHRSVDGPHSERVGYGIRSSDRFARYVAQTQGLVATSGCSFSVPWRSKPNPGTTVHTLDLSRLIAVWCDEPRRMI